MSLSFQSLATALPLSDAKSVGNGVGFEDFDLTMLQVASLTNPPYVVAGLGLAISILCGLTFAKMVQNRLEGWKQDRLALLPLTNIETLMPYGGVVIGVTLFIGASLQVFGFASGAALLVAFVLSLLTAGALWFQLERLMAQVEAGTFSAVDFDNFDQFF